MRQLLSDLRSGPGSSSASSPASSRVCGQDPGCDVLLRGMAGSSCDLWGHEVRTEKCHCTLGATHWQYSNTPVDKDFFTKQFPSVCTTRKISKLIKTKSTGGTNYKTLNDKNGNITLKKKKKKVKLVLARPKTQVKLQKTVIKK